MQVWAIDKEDWMVEEVYWVFHRAAGVHYHLVQIVHHILQTKKELSEELAIIYRGPSFFSHDKVLKD